MPPTLRTAAAALLVALAPLLPVVPAGADEPAPDTTPPAVVFAPCPDSGTGCQRYRATVYDTEVTDDLAVVGARIGDEVLDEYVYDDGTGPRPYGHLAVFPSDVLLQVDWAVSFVVPSGTHVVTFYARDLAGNAVEQDVVLEGATLPGPPRPAAVRRGPRGLAVVGALHADAHGGTITAAEVVKTGTTVVRRLRFLPPSCQCTAYYSKLRPGRHSFRVRARNEVGWSRWVTVSAVVPRRTPS